MHCPKCGQQQLSNEVRFCSRCGFRLSLVAELITNDGLLPVNQALAEPDKRPARPRGVRLGAKLMFLSAVLLPIALGLSIIADSPGPFIIPFTIFLAGFAWMLYSFIFGEESTPRATEITQPGDSARALPQPPPASINMARPRRINTAEIVEPTSVTDHTTRLLEKE
jgi:hypothetical protein